VCICDNTGPGLAPGFLLLFDNGGCAERGQDSKPSLGEFDSLIPRQLGRFSNSRALFSSVQGGFFLREKATRPLWLQVTAIGEPL
jgi:hypothetical protein